MTSIFFLYKKQRNSTAYDGSSDNLHEFFWIGNFSLTAQDRYIRLSLYATLSLITVVGNVLVLSAFYKHPHLRTTTNLFIINLAITDVVTGGIKDTLLVHGLINYNWQQNRSFCSFVGFINAIVHIVTIHTLSAIAIIRYLSIVYNLSNKIKRKHVISTIIGIWIYSFICSALPIFGWSRYEYDVVQCSCLASLNPKYHSYMVFIFIADAMLPLCIITFCYAAVFINIKRNRFHIKREQSNQHKRNATVRLTRKEREMIITRRMLIILAEHIICFLPYSVIVFLLAANGIIIAPIWYFIAGFLVNLNSGLNPFLCILINPRLKEGYLSVIYCKDKSNRIKPTAALNNRNFMQLNIIRK